MVPHLTRCHSEDYGLERISYMSCKPEITVANNLLRGWINLVDFLPLFTSETTIVTSCLLLHTSFLLIRGLL